MQDKAFERIDVTVTRFLLQCVASVRVGRLSAPSDSRRAEVDVLGVVLAVDPLGPAIGRRACASGNRGKPYRGHRGLTCSDLGSRAANSAMMRRKRWVCFWR